MSHLRHEEPESTRRTRLIPVDFLPRFLENPCEMPTEKPANDLENFVQLVLADPALFQQLRQTSGVDHFVGLTVRLGAERNCVFTEEDVRAALDERRRTWQKRWI